MASTSTDDPPATLRDRLQQRNAESDQYLDGKSPARRAWGKGHVAAANAYDAVNSTINNEYLYAIGGGFMGGAGGLVLGTVIGLVAAPLVLSVGTAIGIAGLTAPAIIMTAAAATAIIRGAIGAKDSFFNAKESGNEVSGAKAADRFVQQGHGTAKAQGKVDGKDLIDLEDKLDTIENHRERGYSPGFDRRSDPVFEDNAIRDAGHRARLAREKAEPGKGRSR